MSMCFAITDGHVNGICYLCVCYCVDIVMFCTRYIAGVASLSLQPPDTDNARYHLERAKEMMEKLMEQCKEAEEVSILYTYLSLFISSRCVNVVKDFPFAEQYNLLQEHFSILEDMEQSKSKEGETSMSETSTLGHRRKSNDTSHEMVLADEEEWSTCDESEEA